MKQVITLFVLFLFMYGCSNTRKAKSPQTTNFTSGDTRTKEVILLDDVTFKLVDTTNDKTYGYAMSNPVKVGGANERSGPANERRFLNGLAGPNGEQIQYHRTGSCCGFTTPNGFQNMGLLDRYKVYWEDCRDTALIFINMYDKGDLKIPVGFHSRGIKYNLLYP